MTNAVIVWQNFTLGDDFHLFWRKYFVQINILEVRPRAGWWHPRTRFTCVCWRLSDPTECWTPRTRDPSTHGRAWRRAGKIKSPSFRSSVGSENRSLSFRSKVLIQLQLSPAVCWLQWSAVGEGGWWSMTPQHQNPRSPVMCVSHSNKMRWYRETDCCLGSEERGEKKKKVSCQTSKCLCQLKVSHS